MTRGQAIDHQIVVRQGRQSGTFLNNARQFHDSGYDLPELSPGWHHLATVGKRARDQATTAFYVDGRRVGQVQAKSTSDITRIGDHLTGGQPFGKLAEVRIWHVALGDDEVDSHSKTLLSGNELGPIAYFPMHEATGAEDNYNGATSVELTMSEDMTFSRTRTGLRAPWPALHPQTYGICAGGLRGGGYLHPAVEAE